MSQPHGRILEELASATSFTDGVDRLIAWARGLTGCDMAMFRLKERDADGASWIPALASNGLSFDLLRDEGLIGGEKCLCGRVCSGATLDIGFFTKGGSFSCDRLGEVGAQGLSVLGDLRGRCVAVGFESLLIVPVLAGDAILGCLHLAAFAPDVFAGHVAEVEAAGRLGGSLLAGFPDDEREASVIGAVEAAFTPHGPPSLTSLETAISYGSATDAAHLGGALYEIVELPEGDALLAVGDYSGRGISAAGMAARARQAVAAAAAPARSLEAVLAETQRALRDALSDGRFFTVVVCRYSAAGSLRCAGAGHPFPIVLDVSGGVREVFLPYNAPLGHWDAGAFQGGSVRLLPGQTLLRYTDGITESRHDGRFFGIEGIESVWRESAGLPLPALAESLRRASTDFHDPRLAGDDRLVLLARNLCPTL
jgi:hypothetical protein